MSRARGGAARQKKNFATLAPRPRLGESQSVGEIARFSRFCVCLFSALTGFGEWNNLPARHLDMSDRDAKRGCFRDASELETRL